MYEVIPIEKPYISDLVNYWHHADEDYLRFLGADILKLPAPNDLKRMLNNQINTPFDQKKAFATIWLENGKAIGHSNVNKIEFGKEAYMHLHLWYPDQRRKGVGSQLIKQSIRLFFEKLELETLYCEPNAFNDAPNKTLAKIGFEFIKAYRTIPGAINFEQEVKRWKLSKSNFQKLF